MAGLAAIAVYLAGTLEALERLSLDARFTFRGERPHHAPMVVLAVDEASLSRYGQMPWDRRLFAALLSKLEGAKVIAFDIAFNEPGKLPGEDEALSRAIAKAGNVILPVYHGYASADADSLRLFDPLPTLSRHALGFGLAHFSSRSQPTVLEVEPYQQRGREMVPVLGLAIARAYGAPVKTDNLYYLNHIGPSRSITTRSISEVLEGKVPLESFKDKIVLIGATATGLPDTNLPSPFLQGGPMSGVELHATAAENLIFGTDLKRLGGPAYALVLMAIALTLGVGLLNPIEMPVRRRLAMFSGGTLAMIVVAQLAFASAHFWLDVMPLGALLFGCFLGGTLWQQSNLLRSRNRMLEWYATELQKEAKRQREQVDGELHDEAQQLVIVLSRDLRKATRVLAENPEGAADKLAHAQQLTQRILDEILRVRKNLVPHTLSRSGLKAAVEEMCVDLTARTEVQVVSEVIQWPQTVDGLLESELYWLIKEALNNAIKHAEARTIRITLDSSAQDLTVRIVDDGKGFTPKPLWEPPQGHQHTGLHRMWVRAQALHGDLRLEAQPGSGTRISIRLPFAAKKGHSHAATRTRR